MTFRAIALATIPMLTMSPVVRDDPGLAQRGSFVVRYEPSGPSQKAAVVVTGIASKDLAKLQSASLSGDQWSELLSVVVASSSGKPLPIAGRYHVVDSTLRFEPNYSFDAGVPYQARFDPSRLPSANQEKPVSLEFDGPVPAKTTASAVTRVEPSGDVLPENLLKFYVYFSSPMSRGEVYQRVRIRIESGKVVELAFLELGEELWDPTGTRITLLLDPGRIKRGLVPREEDGPILESGRSYTLEVDREWSDAHGQPLKSAFRKTFRAGPADMKQPDPKSWRIEPPTASTRDPLTVVFPEPLDRAMLEHALVIRTDNELVIPGTVRVDEGSKRWRFTPEKPWPAGRLILDINSELEDLAGNSIARAFEVDAERPFAGANSEASRVRVPFKVSAPRP